MREGASCYEKADDIIICAISDEEFENLQDYYHGNIRSNPRALPKREFGHMPKRKSAIRRVISACSNLYGASSARKVKRVIEKLPWRYNGRLRRAVARCCAVYGNDYEIVVPTHIEFSSVCDIPEDQVERIAVHELCHAARMVLGGRDYETEKGHGREWKALMVESGEEPVQFDPDPRIQADYFRRRGLNASQVRAQIKRVAEKAAKRAGGRPGRRRPTRSSTRKATRPTTRRPAATRRMPSEAEKERLFEAAGDDLEDLLNKCADVDKLEDGTFEDDPTFWDCLRRSV